MADKIKRDSPLVQCVLALDEYLAELERVGTRINSTDMTAAVDVELMQKLMARFAECGQGISTEVANLSARLQEAQASAETVARGVSAQAELFATRRSEHNEKLDRFSSLGERVRELNAAIGQFRRPQGQGLTEEDRGMLTSKLPAFEAQLSDLIDELQSLRQDARDANMKSLEKSAESLAQTLQNARRKLSLLSKPE
jgi:chromosome segregation ATPase